MKIQRKIFEEIIRTIPLVPPESGGLIGGTHQIITHFIFDSGTTFSNGYDRYVPDVSFLNSVIQQWSEIGINFYGIFHSHFPNGIQLSNGDKKYISHIMNAMPQYINSLYFPIILPRESIVAYRADRCHEDVPIVCEEIEIL